MKRPSHSELSGKLRKAHEAATKKQIALVEPEAILSDLLELDFLVSDLAKKLPKILSEVRPENYQGQRPPAKSYERAILSAELFAFRWFSKFFGCEMYLKFAIKADRLWIVSLHRNRNLGGGGGQ